MPGRSSEIDQRICRAIAIHFDPEQGSPYWLARERDLGIDVRRSIRGCGDLALLGVMDENALANLPIEQFVPRSALRYRADLILGETAGTLGRPKFAVHHQWEFHSAFVEPFLVAAQAAGFPRELNWLFVGPSGPHIIGKAARACASAMGSCDPFTVDFDPRWAKRLPRGTLGWTRYLQHLEHQTMAILKTQRIGVIFSTPVVLESLKTRMTPDQRSEVRGIHLGGMAVSGEKREGFSRDFPNAVVISGFGNTLFGMMPELSYSSQMGIDYFPHGKRLVLRTIEPGDDDPATRLEQDVTPGKRGQVVVSRIDHAQLIVNLVERDSAILIDPPPEWRKHGFVLPGIRDPKPIVSQTLQPSLGLY